MRNLYSRVTCGTMLALAVAASAQTLKPGVATIVRIQGEARYSPGDGTWHPLLVGKILGVETIIQTGHDGTVDMVLGKTVEMPQAAQWPDRIGPAPDVNVRGMIDYKPSVEQNMVRMTGDTMLAIDELTVSDTGLDTVSDTELDLKQGRIFCSVKKLSAASEYLVKIPNGVAGVRGTLFEIDAGGWCAVLKSSVLLALVGPTEPRQLICSVKAIDSPADRPDFRVAAGIARSVAANRHGARHRVCGNRVVRVRQDIQLYFAYHRSLLTKTQQWRPKQPNNENNRFSELTIIASAAAADDEGSRADGQQSQNRGFRHGLKGQLTGIIQHQGNGASRSARRNFKMVPLPLLTANRSPALSKASPSGSFNPQAKFFALHPP